MTVGDLKKYLEIVSDDIVICVKQSRKDVYNTDVFYVAETPVISIEISKNSFSLWSAEE